MNKKIVTAFYILGLLVVIVGSTIALYTLGFVDSQSTVQKKEDTSFLTANRIINIQDSDLKELNHYFINGNAEWIYCYKTEVTDDNEILIVDMWRPLMINSSYKHVTHESCDFPRADGSIHPHYNGNCDYSEADAESMRSQGHLFMGIMCGGNKISVYTPLMEELAVFEVGDVE